MVFFALSVSIDYLFCPVCRYFSLVLYYLIGFLFQDNTVKVIYSYHTDDPADQDSISYHGMNRGVISLLLLSKMAPPSIPNDVTNIDILSRPVRDRHFNTRFMRLTTWLR